MERNSGQPSLGPSSKLGAASGKSSARTATTGTPDDIPFFPFLEKRMASHWLLSRNKRHFGHTPLDLAQHDASTIK